MTTTLPGRSSGTRMRSTRVSKISRLIGPPMTKGAIMPRAVRPATKVVVRGRPRTGGGLAPHSNDHAGHSCGGDCRAGRAAVSACHIGPGPDFVHEDQTIRVQIRLDF